MSRGSFSIRDSIPLSSGQATNNRFLLGHTEAKCTASRPSRTKSFELTTSSGYNGNTVCRLLGFLFVKVTFLYGRLGTITKMIY